MTTYTSIGIEAEHRTVCFLRSLRHADGGYSDTDVPAASTLSGTLSVLKALRLLRSGTGGVPATVAFVNNCAKLDSGGFADRPDCAPTAYHTSAALITFQELGRRNELVTYAQSAFQFMADHAASPDDYYMLIAAREECGIQDIAVTAATSFFTNLRRSDGTYGEGTRDNAMACATLMRAGVKLDCPREVVQKLLNAQRDDGGFAEIGRTSDLKTTYLVMRALVLLGVAPDVSALRRYVSELYADGGYAAAPGSTKSAMSTYQSLAVLAFSELLLNKQTPVKRDDITSAVQAARGGFVATTRAWLASGGDPNRFDQDGWTPLLAAASRGQSDVVELLLFNDIPGAHKADPELRFLPADALPLYMAAQIGDLKTVTLLLRARPDHLFEIAAVNGHTVLLQAAFYGFPEHQVLARFLLERVADILGIPEEDRATIQAAQKKLMTATNVRGFNALGMAKLWRNQAMLDLIQSFPQPTEIETHDYLESLLRRIAPQYPEDPNEESVQSLSDAVVCTIQASLRGAEQIVPSSRAAKDAFINGVLNILETLAGEERFDVNRLGGMLQQPPLVVASTDRDANDSVTELRMKIVDFLLRQGADPSRREKHPMGVNAVIRAAVLDHFELLKMFADNMSPAALSAAMNEKPAVNGQTALHDSVHRALTAPPDVLRRLLEQISWMVARGANTAVEDHAGKTPATMARAGLNDTRTRANAASILNALKLS